MRDIELNWQESVADRDLMITALLEAVGEAIEPGNVTLLTANGDPVAGIAPAGQIVQEHPDTVMIPRSDMGVLLAAAALLRGAGNPAAEAALRSHVDAVLARYKTHLDVAL